jgi:Zn-dependent protease
MPEFYQVDSAKVSLREYWWGSRSPLVIIGWILKWLRLRLPSSTDDPNTDSTLPFVSPALPPQIEGVFAPLTQQLAQLGFLDPVFHQIYDGGSSTTWYWATFRHTSGQHLARIHHRTWGRVTKPKPVLFPMFMTRFADGTFLVSSAGKPDLAAPETVPMIRRQGATPEALWPAHEAAALQSGKPIVPVTSPAEIVSATEALHVALRDFHLARGVFRPRTEAEAAKAQALTAQVQAARGAGFEDAEVLVELEKLQNKKTSKQMMIWILLGSLAAFLALGTANWNWQTTLWLVPVLLLHEAGHWAAMHVFRYRNLRMFFIPMFGAAVMGQNWNVPGWKKGLVSLAGPLPGIALGLALGIASIAWHSPWMNKAALMLLLINGLNLLPILPLDGGHVLQVSIFCRNRWLEAAFQLLAVAGLLLLGVSGKIFFYLAIAIAIGIPITFKLAKAREELGKLDLPQPGPDDDRIPPPTAQAIVRAVKAAFGARLRPSNKTLAQHSLNVFESMNARPPTTLATIGLLALQAGGLFVAVVMGLVLAFVGHFDVKDLARVAARQPHLAVNPTALQQLGAPAGPGPRHLIVASFPKESKAADAYLQLTNRVPADSVLTLYGQTVLLSLPAGDEALREKWFDLLQERSTNLFVLVSNAPLVLSLTFIAPDRTTASNLTQEIGEYLNASTWMRLLPPWSPAARGPAYARARHARAAWQQIEAQLASVSTNAEITANYAKIRAATKRGAAAEARKLSTAVEAKRKQLHAAALQDLAARSDPAGAELVKLYENLQDLPYTNRVERQRLYRTVAARLGEIPYLGDNPDPKANADGAVGGAISTHGLLCELRWGTFGDPQGVLTLTRWLDAKGCLQLKYDLQPGWGGWSASDEDPDER